MSANHDFPINGFDHLHFIVGNALQAAHYYRTAFGFSLKAFRGPATGTNDHASYVLEQGQIRLVLSAPLASEHPMYDHIRTHGDGIRDVAFSVDDPAAAWKTAVERGAESAYEPSALEDDQGVLRMAGIQAFGGTIHSFISRKNYRGVFRPGFRAAEGEDPIARPAGLLQLESLAAILNSGELKRWTAFYEQVLGFSAEEPSGEFSANMSKATAGGQGRIGMLLTQPGGKSDGQIEKYLEAYQGAGVQCVGMSTTGTMDTVSLLRSQGVRFESHRFRTLTEPVQDRQTLSYEIIECKDGRGFR